MVDGLHSKSSYGFPEDGFETALLDLRPGHGRPRAIRGHARSRPPRAPRGGGLVVCD